MLNVRGGSTWPRNGLAQPFLKLKSARSRAKDAGPSLSSLKRFARGETYQLSRAEKRGRSVTITKRILSVADTQRKLLIKKARNEYTVSGLSLIHI